MKRRGNKRVKPQNRRKKCSEQSTNEGQPGPTLEAVLEPDEGNKTPGNLEPEKEAGSLQNLEKSEATVAPVVALDAGLEPAMYRAAQSWLHSPLMPKPLPR